MIYREAGQFRTSYAQDSQLLPLRQDRLGMALMMVVAFVVIPFASNDYWLSAILIPWLILSLVALGQNILMGYAGQLSLGSAGFMAAGAFACYNLILRVPGIPFVVAILLSGVCAALIGIVFGLPSLRIRGLYLAVATLASQFFIVWALDKFGWFKNYDPAGVITAQKIVIFGHNFASPREKYWVVLVIVAALALAAKNMARGSIGRGWMAMRDMDVAAEVMGLSLLRTKLQAFAISSFYCGVGGALFAFAYLQTVEPSAFNIDLSFRILFMIIIGGTRHDPWLLPGRRVHSADASFPEHVLSHRVRQSRRRDHHVGARASHLRRDDHHVPDLRTARPGTALATSQGKVAAMAVSALTKTRCPTHRIFAGRCAASLPTSDDCQRPFI